MLRRLLLSVKTKQSQFNSSLSIPGQWRRLALGIKIGPCPAFHPCCHLLCSTDGCEWLQVPAWGEQGLLPSTCCHHSHFTADKITHFF